MMLIPNPLSRRGSNVGRICSRRISAVKMIHGKCAFCSASSELMNIQDSLTTYCPKSRRTSLSTKQWQHSKKFLVSRHHCLAFAIN
ncbi:unnamed protein product, partial [Dicrocoelium dendriticum]